MEQLVKAPGAVTGKAVGTRAAVWWLAFTSCVVIAALALPLMLASLWIFPHVENRELISAAFVAAIVALRALEIWRKAWR